MALGSSFAETLASLSTARHVDLLSRKCDTRRRDEWSAQSCPFIPLESGRELGNRGGVEESNQWLRERNWRAGEEPGSAREENAQESERNLQNLESNQ